MAWIEYHEQLRDHWKIKRLAKHLGVSYPQALGHVSCLWLWVVGNKPDGDVSKFQPEEIASAGMWRGKAAKFADALRDCELVDASGLIHDWERHGLRVLVKARERVKRFRNAPGNVTVRSTKKERKERKKERTEGKKELPHQTIINRFLELQGTDRAALTREQVSGAYSRHSRSAIALIREAGGLEYAIAAIDWGARYFPSRNLSWTLDTIAKHLPTFARCGRDAEAARKYGLNPGEVRYAQRLGEWLLREQAGGGGMFAGAAQGHPVDGSRSGDGVALSAGHERGGAAPGGRADYSESDRGLPEHAVDRAAA